MVSNFTKDLFKFIFGVVFGLTVILIFSSSVLASGFAKTTDRVRLREWDSTEAHIITTLNPNSKVETYEVFGDWTKVKYGEKIGFVNNEFIKEISEEEAAKLLEKSSVELLPWYEAKDVVSIGTPLEILDIYTGKVYYIKSFSNGNHADVEPITKEDTSILKSTYGGVWKWDPRPVLVNVNGRAIAASINGMPHGGGRNSNNGMNGQICLHFKGSSTHNGNSSFTRWHQDVLMEAYNLTK